MTFPQVLPVGAMRFHQLEKLVVVMAHKKMKERGPIRAVLSHGGLDYVLKRDGEAYLGSESRSRYGVRVTIDMRLEGDGMSVPTERGLQSIDRDSTAGALGEEPPKIAVATFQPLS